MAKVRQEIVFRLLTVTPSEVVYNRYPSYTLRRVRFYENMERSEFELDQSAKAFRAARESDLERAFVDLKEQFLKNKITQG